MEPNTNEATAPKRLKTGGKKPIIIIGVIVAVLLAAYVGLCAYANSQDIFYPNTTINGVDVAGLTAEQAAERLRQEIPEETVEFYLPLADETGDGESAPEGDMLYGADPDAVCTYRELGITEELDYEVSAQSAFDAVQGRSSFFVKGWEYLACLVGADGQLGVVLEPEEDIFQVKMEQLSEQFSREAQDASYEVTEDAVEITKALNGLSVSAADLARTAQERWTGSGNGAAASVFVNNARILPAKTLTAQEIYDDCSGVVKNASYDKETGAIVPEEVGADFDVEEAQKLLDAAEPGETVTALEIPEARVEDRDGRAILAVMDQEIDITDALTEDGRYEYKYEDEGAQLTVLVEGTPEDWTMTTSIRVPGQEDTVSAVFAKEEQDRGTALTPSHAADVPADSEQDISAQEAPSVIFDGKEAAAVQTAPNS